MDLQSYNVVQEKRAVTRQGKCNQLCIFQLIGINKYARRFLNPNVTEWALLWNICWWLYTFAPPLQVLTHDFHDFVGSFLYNRGVKLTKLDLIYRKNFQTWIRLSIVLFENFWNYTFD